nr:reverse transcriptase domain-containing protein [Tanacetum cinerariifolium]
MRTRSSSNLSGESSPNPTSSNPKHRNRRRLKQPFILEESLVDTMADQRTLAELLRAPTEGYAEAIVVPPILAEQFELKHRAAHRWLEKEPPRSILTWEDLVSKFINEFFPPQERQISVMKFQTFNNGLMNRFIRHRIDTKISFVHALIMWQSVGKTYSRCVDDFENKSKVRNSRNKSIISQVKSSDANSSSSSEIAKLTYAVNQHTSAVTTAMTAILKQFQATPSPASVKAVEEICEDERVKETLTDPKLAVILKKLPKKLGDLRKFLIPCGFCKLKCKSLADLGASINLMPLSVWKKVSTTSSSPNLLLEEFTDELALIIFPSGNDDLPFDIESDLKEIEYLLNHDPTKKIDYILEDSVDEGNLAEPNDNLFDTIPEMFTNEHTLDYSSLLVYDEYDDDIFEIESDNDDAYNDPFDSKGEKIKESKLLIDKLDLPRSSDFLPSPEYDSFLFENFFEVDALPSSNNEDKVFNPGILIQENLFKDTVQAIPDKNVKKIAISHASLILEDFDPPLYELPFHKKVPWSETLLLFSFKNEEKVFKPGILTSKGVHTSLLLELSHQDPKAFKIIKILESPMEIFPCSFREDNRILDVPCLHFYPS